MGIWGPFSYFSAIFVLFSWGGPGEAETYMFFLLLFLFRAGGPKPILYRPTGSQPQRFASDSASQKFRCDTVRVPSATWAYESQRFLVTRVARSVKLPSFRHFQDQFLTTYKEKWGRKVGLCFAMFVFLTFRRPLAQESPRQTKPKKGPKRKVREFRPFL